MPDDDPITVFDLLNRELAHARDVFERLGGLVTVDPEREPWSVYVERRLLVERLYLLGLISEIAHAKPPPAATAQQDPPPPSRVN
jgi:hypothetical protein